MKKYIFISILASCSLLVNAQIKEEQEPYLTRPLSGDAIKNVEVETSGGSISVSGVALSEARIEVYVNTNNKRSGDERLSKEEIQKRLDADYELTISVNNGKVGAIARSKDRNMDWKQALSISFHVFVPKNVSTVLQTSGGSIKLKDILGTQDFKTSGGGLSITNTGGNIKGRTSGGSIHVVDSKGEMNLSTSGGGINAADCAGTLRLSTSGGSINLTELNGTINANTSGGGIKGDNIKGELISHTSGGSIKLTDLFCSLETSTSGGNIDVSIKEFGQYVKISNWGGNIDLQIPGDKGLDLKLRANSIKTGTLNNFSGSTDDDEVTGKLNGGGVPVTVRAGSGRINLDMK